MVRLGVASSGKEDGGNFKETDPAFLIIPEDLHAAVRGIFDDAERENVGPNYKCPFIDPYWALRRLRAA